MVSRVVFKGQFWVVISVVKRGSFGGLLVWLKRGSLWVIIRVVKKR